MTMPRLRLARRKLLAVLGVAAGASLGGCAIRPKPTRGPLAALVGPIGPQGTWRVEQVLPVVAGAIPVLLRAPDGGKFQVDVLKAEAGGPRAVAQVGPLALCIANRGDGATPSAEAEALGARLLAARIEQVTGETGWPEVHGLMTLSERLAAHRQAVLTPWS
jgi:hypothetical protein